LAKSSRRQKIDLAILPEGREIVEEEIAGTRDHRNVVCRPGDFVWKYRTARRGDRLYSEVQYQAGMRFAELWEAAGASSPQSVEWGRPPSAKGYRGITDPVCDALDKFRRMAQHVGKISSTRLYDHVVLGLTTKEMAHKWNVPERIMSAVLSLDLDAVVDFFGYTKER
jgi:hypothetical protein